MSVEQYSTLSRNGNKIKESPFAQIVVAGSLDFPGIERSLIKVKPMRKKSPPLLILSEGNWWAQGQRNRLQSSVFSRRP